MPYDESLDVTIHESIVAGDEAIPDVKNIEFKVASYNGGVPKLQMVRVSAEGYHAKLGRLTKVEIERVRDKLTELLEAQLVEEDELPEQPEEEPEEEPPATKDERRDLPF